MALYSPAYVALRTNSIKTEIHTDRKNNFVITGSYYTTNTVWSTPAHNYQCEINMRRHSLFNNIYACQFDSLIIKTYGYVNISRNSIIASAPLNKQSMIAIMDQFLMLYISDKIVDNPNVVRTSGSTTTSLGNYYVTARPTWNNLFNDLLFSSCNVDPFTGNIPYGLTQNIYEFVFEIPLNFIYEQYRKSFYLYTYHGVGQPNYGLDLDSTAGNGLLDHELSAYRSYTAVGERNLAGCNYGSYNYAINAPTNPVNARITSWDINTNFYLSGKILELK